ncbi:metallophosphoesterase [Clostridium sp. P21]|uniref:Metallophosphoesterase n=1 Tax=Clostridium muellerianum TaxID=2716538 RepID=A0A7Y0EH76_9CLOT|nr:metallophosphoesterase [Clostridium muellerianum]NMM63425.1 metallophosphoesterase [Clostridium muellerianum]
MKKLKITGLILIVIILVISWTVYKNKISNKVVHNSKKVVSSTNKEAVPKKEELNFSVLGDVHGNIYKLKNAIGDLHTINANMDALIFNGDNVDQGLKSQYDALKNTLDNKKDILPKIIIKNIGNHEYFDYARGKNNLEDVERLKNMYLDFAGENSIYHDKWIKGYHFISLGSESGNTRKPGSSVNAFLSENQLEWLQLKLAEKHKKGKPIFVFLHQHLETSIEGWIGIEQREELSKILSEYPEVILFTSHTHVLLGVDNVRTDQPFATVHTGAVHYAILPEEGYRLKRIYNESQGLYVEVHGDKVVVKGRDFAKKTWIFSKEIDTGNKIVSK